MANDIPDIILNGTWQNIYTLSGIAVGASLSIQNKSSQTVNVWIGANAPASNFVGGYNIPSLSSVMINTGESGYWALGHGPILVQAL